MRIFFCFCCVFFSLTCIGAKAAVPKHFGLIAHSIKDARLGEINFYITDTLHTQKKPLLLYLDGSGDNALFTFKADKNGKYNVYSSIPFNYKKLALQYHVVFISKPGVALADTLNGEVEQKNNATYQQLLSAEWRTNSASLVVNFVLKKYAVEKKRVAVFGYSEGAQVAPRLACINKHITHCIAFVGGGLNQLFNQLMEQRIAAQKGEISEEQAQQNIDSLYLDYEKIYNQPLSTNQQWYGHTYLRWGSFCAEPSITFFTRLNIPVYIAQGTADESTHVLSADYIKLEFLRLQKKNLTHKIYPGCDHMFNKAVEKNGKTAYINLLDEAIEAALKWLENPQSGR